MKGFYSCAAGYLSVSCADREGHQRVFGLLVRERGSLFVTVAVVVVVDHDLGVLFGSMLSENTQFERSSSRLEPHIYNDRSFYLRVECLRWKATAPPPVTIYSTW